MPGNFDDDDDEEERKPVKDSSYSAAPKGLSSMLPAPKNSLCLGPTASASRRFAFDFNASVSSHESSERREEKAEGFDGGEQREGSSFQQYASHPVEQGAGDYVNYGSYDGNWAANGSAEDVSYASGSYQSVDYENYGSYEGNWNDGNTVAVATLMVPEIERVAGKRGRNEMPTKIIEVNQAELMKNRPREDQAKVTGIAFGPAYQVKIHLSFCLKLIYFLSSHVLVDSMHCSPKSPWRSNS